MGLRRILEGLIAQPPPTFVGPGGGLPFSDLYPSRAAYRGVRPRIPGSVRTLAPSTSSTIIAPANLDRVGLTIRNGTTDDLYVALAGVASTTAYTVLLVPDAVYILETPDCYAGDVAAVSPPGATGSIDVTEQTRGQ